MTIVNTHTDNTQERYIRSRNKHDNLFDYISRESTASCLSGESREHGILDILRNWSGDT